MSRPAPTEPKYSSLSVPRTVNPRRVAPSYGSVLRPAAAFVLAGGVAVGNHFFNRWADGHEVGNFALSQQWVTRATTAFAFGLQTALSTMMGFVLCQLIWYYVQRGYMSVKDIDTIYDIERRRMAATIASRALVHSPLLVAVSLLSYSLPIPAVFSNAALSVATSTLAGVPAPCTIPTGNLSLASPSSYLFSVEGVGFYFQPLGAANRLATQALVGQRLPQLAVPQPCVGNCTYRVSIDSAAFDCKAAPRTG
ncbi:hypothetical protein FA95DRAFT_285285 [Auriscalpium vulgare]|uniref:Uncharacterized protein n=1 Tax=Auriscalpium vulgare TaxID=40419 RepID=A0ACB8RJM5_9AGAM|nr:hypothetical protein FA95DRAFT_285285 [Auriscalpium vulgare]